MPIGLIQLNVDVSLQITIDRSEMDSLMEAWAKQKQREEQELSEDKRQKRREIENEQ